MATVGLNLTPDLSPDLKLYEAVVQVAKNIQQKWFNSPSKPKDRYGFRITNIRIPHPFDLSISKPSELSKYQFIEQHPGNWGKYWGYNTQSFTSETILERDASLLRASIGEMCDAKIKELSPNFPEYFTELVTKSGCQQFKKPDRSKGEILVCLISMVGSRTDLRCNPKIHTVDQLKQKFEKVSGVPVDQQRLIFKGKQLEDGYLLSHYEIEDNCSLHLCLRLRGGMYHISSQVIGDDSRFDNVYSFKNQVPEHLVSMLPITSFYGDLQIQHITVLTKDGSKEKLWCHTKAPIHVVSLFVHLLADRQTTKTQLTQDQTQLLQLNSTKPYLATKILDFLDFE